MAKLAPALAFYDGGPMAISTSTTANCSDQFQNLQLQMQQQLQYQKQKPKQPDLGKTGCVNLEEITSNYMFYIQIVAIFVLNVHIVLGNLMVILAVYTYRKLRQNQTNTFIVSLAFSDFLLGIAVMPFTSTYFLMNKHWIFGTLYCRFWLAVDVWLCTASILNLVAISYERYLAIKKPMSYSRLMTSRRIRMLLVGVWILALMISIPGFITNDGTLGNGAESQSVALSNSTCKQNETTFDPMELASRFTSSKNSGGNNRNKSNDSAVGGDSAPGQCLQRIDCSISDSSPTYIVYSSWGSFFLPAAIMLGFYVEIYKTARRALHAMNTGQILTKCQNSKDVVVLRVHIGGNSVSNCHYNYNYNGTQSKYCKAEPDERQTTAVHDSVCAQPRDSENGESKPMHEAPVAKGTFTPDANSDVFTDAVLTTQSPAHGEERHPTQSVSGDAPYDYGSQHSGSRGEPLSRSTTAINRTACKKHSTLSATHSALGVQHSRTNRETKAAKTVAIICGSFLLCWLGFFCAYLLSAFCDRCVPDLAWDIFFWMGYFNSACNPCVYALFSRDFRTGFSRLLRSLCCCKSAKRKQFYGERTSHIRPQTTRRLNAIDEEPTRNYTRYYKTSTTHNPMDDHLISAHVASKPGGI